jgi:hypothetical protein
MHTLVVATNLKRCCSQMCTESQIAALELQLKQKRKQLATTCTELADVTAAVQKVTLTH